VNRFTPSRQAALDRLNQFVPHAAEYTFNRNFADERCPGVSGLSPYIRHRLVSEAEVCRAVLDRHRFEAVEKFIQEVCWRTYWKGWLEMRPGIWDRYVEDCRRLRQQSHVGLAEAEAGQTGLECYDHWAQELIENGYLHNHVRMWFASIWIFTLKLPWQLGADFFYRHLLDADPASNTLSWRWVAGLHTPGKHYLARAENIRKFTGGHFNPHGQLNESASPLPQESPVPVVPLPDIPSTLDDDGRRRGLLLFAEDLSPESVLPPSFTIQGIAGGLSEPFSREKGPEDFTGAAIAESGKRLAGRFGCEFTPLFNGNRQEALKDWAARGGFEEIIIIQPHTGPWKTALETSPIPCPVRRIRRSWDSGLFPFASRGYFHFKKQGLQRIHERSISRP
jgi:deoxyribodipyrimidine photo-lyase